MSYLWAIMSPFISHTLCEGVKACNVEYECPRSKPHDVVVGDSERKAKLAELSAAKACGTFGHYYCARTSVRSVCPQGTNSYTSYIHE